jgi:hypothetical protein
MALVLGVIGSLALSFLGAGLFWIGMPSGQILVALLFMFFAYSVSHVSGKRVALLATLLPPAPLAGLLVQFRDPNGSHLISIAIVLAWAAGAVIGALCADRARTSYRRFLACVGIAGAAHALAALASLLVSFGGAMQAFDGHAPATGTATADRLANLLLEPAVSLLAGAPWHAAAGVQWIAFAVNSLAWGIPLGILLAGLLRLTQSAAPATTG